MKLPLSRLQWAWVALLTYPWLNPFSVGPSALVLPWLLALACVTVAAWGFYRINAASSADNAAGWGVQSWLALWLLAWAILVVWRSPSFGGDTVFTLVALMFLAVAITMGSKAAYNKALQGVIVTSWLLAAVVSAVIALFQYLAWAPHFYPWMNVTDAGTAFGNLRQPNQLATLLNIGVLSLLFGSALSNRLSAAEPPAREPSQARHWLSTSFGRAGPWLVLCTLVVGNALTSSRTGALGIGLIALLAWCWRKHLSSNMRLMGLVAPLVYVLAALLMPYVSLWVTGTMGGSLLIRLGALGDAVSTCQSRVFLYSNVLDLIQIKPWLGWGWRDLMYAHYVGQFNTRFCGLLDNAHNLPLHLAVELGLPAALLLLVLPLWFTIKAKPWRATEPIQLLAWGVLALIALHSMLEYPLWYSPFMLAFGLCLGLLWPGSNGKALSTSSGLVLARLRGGVTVLALGALLWVGLGYARVSQFFTVPSERVAAFTSPKLADISPDWLYADHFKYYQLSTTSLTPENAMARVYLATRLMHYSPEPRVIVEQINAAYMAELDRTTLKILEARFQAAYPKEYQIFKFGKAPQ